MKNSGVEVDDEVDDVDDVDDEVVDDDDVDTATPTLRDARQ